MPSRLHSGKWKVYILLDPRDKLPKYVGCSENAMARIGQHLTHTYTCSLELGAWLSELWQLGLFPEYEIVEKGMGPSWWSVEQSWMAHYRSQGIQLLNRLHNSKEASESRSSKMKQLWADVRSGKVVRKGCRGALIRPTETRRD